MTVTKVRLLAVTFDIQLPPWKLPRFRGAMAHKVGLQHEWFHNHNNETGGFHQRYPLIQYKVNAINGGFQPMLLCVEEGVEEAQHFFSQPNWDLHIGCDRQKLNIAKLNVQQHTLSVWDGQDFRYRIHNWQALNTRNYSEFRRLTSQSERFAFLENILTSQILTFARGVDWVVPRHFDMQITKINSEKWVSYKGVKVLAFTTEFSSNVSLPDWIGLGKGGSVGFGVVRRRRDEK